MRRFLPLLAFAFAAGLCACDSSSGEDAAAFPCLDGVSSFAACGGNPTGRWTFDGVCVSGPALFANTTMMRDCPQVQVVVEMDWQGSIEFADGTSTFRMTGLSSDTTLTIPGDCLHGVDCADAVDEPGYACAESGDTCVCRQQTTGGALPQDVAAYEVDGTDLVMQADGEVNRAAFCVKGDRMAMQVWVGEDAPEGERGGSKVPAVLTLRKE